MTKRQIAMLAHEIRNMEGEMPDFYRLMFARSIRDVIQVTKTFPNWDNFLKRCNLTGDEKRE